MSLIFFEGFEGLTDTLPLMIKVLSLGEITTDQARSGDASLLLDGTTSAYTYLPLPTDSQPSVLYVGFGLYMPTLPTNSGYSFLRFYCDKIATAYMAVNSNGTITTGGSAARDTSVLALSAETWHYVEIKMTITNSTAEGDVIVMVDGVEFINCPAGRDYLNLSETNIDAICFRGNQTGDKYIDDLYICTEEGSVNNTFLGPVKIATLRPTGSGTTSDFVGVDADSTDNYLNIDNDAADDTDYIESNTPDDVDLFEYDAMPSSDVICGVQLVSLSKKVLPGGRRLLRGLVRIDGTNYEGNDHGVRYNVESADRHIWEENPDDSAEWESSDITGAEFGIKVQE